MAHDSKRPARRDAAGTVDVVLSTMPFGLLQHPSIALGLLQASLVGPTCRSVYFTLPFADLIGAELYQWISAGAQPHSQFLGEYLFRHAAFPGTSWDDEDFWQRPMQDGGWDGVPDNLIPRLEGVRRQVAGFLDDCCDELLALRPKIVGFTSVFQQQLASLALARRLKDFDPDLFIVFGGANCEGPMGREMIRQFEFLDAVVSGEGEIVFPELVDRVLQQRSIENLQGVSSAIDRSTPDRSIDNAPRIADMDSLPVPNYADFFEAWNRSGLGKSLSPSLSYETSRGCWWGEKQHCTFCGLNGAGMTFRSKSGERALSELDFLLTEYPVKRVQVVDNILDMRYFKDFIPALAEKDWNIQLFYEVKSNLGKEHLRRLEAAGITQIQPGIESFSDSVLRAMGKGVTRLQNVRLLKWCEEIGVRPLWNVLWGFPSETPDDYEEMAGLMPLLSHLAPPRFGGKLRIDRFSPNFERSDSFGFTDVKPDAFYRHLYPLDPQALQRLAYYFDFRYQDSRDVASYTKSTRQAILEWQQSHSPGALFYVDSEDGLLIWDRRAAARSSLTVLQSTDRLLYQECDDIRSLRQLRRLLEARIPTEGSADLEARLQALVDRGLMLRDGEKFLSLAVQRSFTPAVN